MSPHPRLPADDDTAGLREYADTVVEAIGDRADVIVVAQSIAAFTAPMLCDRVDVRLLVLVAPTSGSTGGTATTTSPPPAGH